ncbi:MAG: hypothetical protein HY427_01095 [Candidatus Levybacteria bacterium]|nr:hypothetical protein [Candidatus Levybacteria bacterium]
MTERTGYFEDFTLGEFLEHEGQVKLERNLFIKLVLENGFADQTIHVDRDYAISQGYKDIILPGPIVYTIIFRLTRRDVSWIGLNVGTDKMKHTAAVYPEDTLRAKSSVSELSEWHGSRGVTHGLVKVQTTGFNQDGLTVIEFSRSVLNPFKPS